MAHKFGWLLWQSYFGPPQYQRFPPEIKLMATIATEDYSYLKGLSENIVIVSMRGRGLQEILDGTGRVPYLRYVHISLGCRGVPSKNIFELLAT